MENGSDLDALLVFEERYPRFLQVQHSGKLQNLVKLNIQILYMSKFVKSEIILDNLERFFNKSEPKSFSIIPTEESYEISTLNNEEMCLRLTIKDDIIHLENLNKCGTNSGKQLLRMIDDFAKISKISKIILTDDSHKYICDIDINLAKLNLLANGSSWYNLHEYYSQHYEEEKQNNLDILKREMNEYFEECIIKQCKNYENFLKSLQANALMSFYDSKNPMVMENADYLQKIKDIESYRADTIHAMSNYKSRLESYLPEIKESYKTYFTKPNYSVQEFFTIIKQILERIPPGCTTDAKVKIISEIIMISSLFLKYKVQLIKSISKGGSRKKQSKRKKNQKSIAKKKSKIRKQ